MNERIQLREEITGQLKSFGITGKDVYFIDYIPLIEMIWADGEPQQGEIDIFYDFLEKHVAHLNKMAGYSAFRLEEAAQFVSGLLKERPSRGNAENTSQTFNPQWIVQGKPRKESQFRKIFAGHLP